MALLGGEMRSESIFMHYTRFLPPLARTTHARVYPSDNDIGHGEKRTLWAVSSVGMVAQNVPHFYASVDVALYIIL